MKILIHLVCLLLVSPIMDVSEGRFFRQTSAIPAIIKDDIYAGEAISVKQYNLTGMLRGNGFRRVSYLELDTVAMAHKLERALMHSQSTFQVHSGLNHLSLLKEVGCPPSTRRQRRFPCTLHAQHESALDLQSQASTLVAVPAIYVEIAAHKLPAGAYVAYAAPYSGYDLNYIGYTLVMNIYRGGELVYYDQHTYFREETLPQGELPECHIPQAAMDSLVTLTMKGYMDRMK